jgi:Mrp family chromosome partitioning ATPase
MNDKSAFGVIKRRWWVIVLLALIGAGFGAIPAPEKVAEKSKLTRYSATHTLLINNSDTASSGAAVISPNQVTLLATAGEVPSRVAEQIKYPDNPAILASQVVVSFDATTGALTISTTQDTAEQAEQIANAFADVLNSYLAERQDVIYQQRLSAGLDRLNKLEEQLKELTAQLANAPDDPVITAQRDAVSRQYSVAFEQNQVLSESPVTLAFTTLQRAQAVPIETGGGGLSAPKSRSTRGALGLFAGVAVGIAVALLLGGIDRVIRTREQAEAIMALRTRVTIPKVAADRRGLVVTNDRHDSLSDAYRTLRNVIGFIHGGLEPTSRGRVTLVLSPGPNEGKTSLAANLAAAFVEAGQHTIAVNTDFRRPRLAGMLCNGPIVLVPFGLDEVSTLQPNWLLKETIIPNLDLMDLSTLDGSAGELVRATAATIPMLCTTADAVVIDTSPVGATAEVLELVPVADVIVIVVRVGQTPIGVAERTIEILRDLTTVPMVLVLTGIKAGRTGYYEYGDRHPAGTEREEFDHFRAARRVRREKVG